MIIQKINKVPKLDIEINQIDELKLNNFECGIELRDNEGEVLSINGTLMSFRSFGKFQIDFQAANNSLEYNIFKETVG